MEIISAINNESKTLQEHDETSTRKKYKKREKSPVQQQQQSSQDCNSSATSSTLANANDITKSNTIQTQQQANTSNNLAANNNSLQASASNCVNKKEKQRPETWNKVEQQIFFNALRQNGKNFESITQYFNARQKRFKVDDGVSVQRSKEQIRHFYYRTWHKIIKHVTIPNLNENANQANNATAQNGASVILASNSNCSVRDIQVKCLIAYNCLMNKSQRWNKKTSIKLVELVNHGWTTVREKGKITRLRMPICKVSSKTVSNEFEASNQLPTIINIQLEPKSESAYCRVHQLAQNPFLNIEIQTLQSVKFLIEFLENKWKSRRNQFIEKFQIESNGQSKSAVKTNTLTLSNSKSTSDQQPTTSNADPIDIEKNSVKINENTNNNSGLANNNNKNSLFVNERLILFPNECHQVKNVDLIEGTTQSIISSIDTDQMFAEANKNSDNNFLDDNVDVEMDENNKMNKTGFNKAQKLLNHDTPMDEDFIISQAEPGTDDCVAQNTLVNNSNKQGSKKSLSKEKTSKCYFQVQADFIKSGLTSFNTNVQATQNAKDSKDLTIIQLYLALNKPNVIKLKYDWIIPNNSLSNNFSSSTANTQSSSSNSFYTLAFSQAQQQRFYIDTLATVAASFLSEMMVKPKQQLQTQQVDNNSKNSTTNLITSSANKLIKSPPKASTSTKLTINEQSIAFIQPNSSPGASATATIVPVETVLQRINDDQTNKTKILLSDLSTKRRPRQRKPIMVVNSSHTPRNVMPKINLINAITTQQANNNSSVNSSSMLPPPPLLIKPTDNSNTNNNIQSPLSISSPSSSSSSSSNNNNNNLTLNEKNNQLVYSGGPLVAVARQIVNNATPFSAKNNNPQSNNTSNSNLIENSKSNKLMQSFHQYSNLIPQILHTLSDKSDQTENANQNVITSEIDNKEATSENNNLNLVATSPNGFTNMSLLELTMNNNDSFFASALNVNNNEKNENPNENKNNNPINTRLNENNHDETNEVLNLFSNNQSLQLSSALKMKSTDENFVEILNENSSSLSGILNSLNCKSNPGNSTGLITTATRLFGTSNSSNHDNTINVGIAPNVTKRSEVLVEWTDSMNDVSLTSCFLNDIQSPEKSNKANGQLINILNENSRDSIFFNLDTMDIQLTTTTASKYEDTLINK